MNSGKAYLRALIVEDQEDDTLLLVRELEQVGGFTVEHHRVETKDDLQAALKQRWDIVFSDYSMPQMNGLEALPLVRAADPDVPFIFVSGTIGEDIAVEAMRNGAQDYIMKDNLKRLVPAVTRELHEHKVRKAQRAAQQRVLYLARFDTLTGLPNRAHFLEKTQEAIAQNSSGEFQLGVVYIDLDRFKSVNDSLGYAAGDQVLKETANRLKRRAGEDGFVARFAADEFGLLIIQNGGRNAMVRLINSILRGLEHEFTVHDWQLHLSASIGVAILPTDGSTADDLLRNADIAAYRAKEDGGRRFLFYGPDMAVELEQRLGLERNLRLGINRGEFDLFYQPQVKMANRRIVGVEALLRWNNPELGVVSPAHFIPLAEQTGLILPLGRWVIRQACQQIKRWKESNFRTVRIAVNVSARQFLEDNLPEFIGLTLREFDIDPHLFEVEITETAIMGDTARAIEVLSAIKRLGVKVALDDFGTGYSSLSYLKVFKTDYLKIDQSFIRGLPEDNDDREIVGAIIAMADKLSIDTIAEGVETEAQYNFLKSQGCDFAQGYYISRPTLPKDLKGT